MSLVNEIESRKVTNVQSNEANMSVSSQQGPTEISKVYVLRAESTVEGE